MTVQDVQHIIESWAPREIAWERDNVGLQAGDPAHSVRRILVALDATPQVVEEARKKKVDLIVTHHPLLFRPLLSVTTRDRAGMIATQLVRNGIALYSAHTNLDFVPGGVSHALAERLGLKKIQVLSRMEGALKKVVAFVPQDYVDKVMEAMAAAGAGIIGKYDQCSFRLEGTGTFRAREGARPFLGEVGKFERVSEYRLEVVVPKWRMREALQAMRSAHPYEEIAYDVYPLDNELPEYGAGAYGELPAQMTLKGFLKRVKEELHAPMLRHVGDPNGRVRIVAVCGGSGGDLLETAVRVGAHVFVTAELKYHDFEAAQNRIALIDAGHFETEQFCVAALIRHLQQHVERTKEDVEILRALSMSNPIQYF